MIPSMFSTSKLSSISAFTSIASCLGYALTTPLPFPLPKILNLISSLSGVTVLSPGSIVTKDQVIVPLSKSIEP